MALIICPDCGHEISDRAAACPHCGCPVSSELLYAVVLRATDYNDPRMTARIQAATGLPEEKAEEVPLRLPFTLKRGLTYEECNALIRTFSANTCLDLIRDEDADTPENAVPIAQSVPQTTKPITFWTIVGGCLTALGLWSIVCFILLNLFR